MTGEKETDRRTHRVVEIIQETAQEKEKKKYRAVWDY